MPQAQAMWCPQCRHRPCTARLVLVGSIQEAAKLAQLQLVVLQPQVRVLEAEIFGRCCHSRRVTSTISIRPPCSIQHEVRLLGLLTVHHCASSSSVQEASEELSQVPDPEPCWFSEGLLRNYFSHFHFLLYDAVHWSERHLGPLQRE